jgi:hypothetical protein
MSELWDPQAVRKPAPRTLWGREQRADLGVLHTVEPLKIDPIPILSIPDGRYLDAGGTSYPTSTIGMVSTTEAATFQHYPANISCRALLNERGGVETNQRRPGVVQLELHWRADSIKLAPDVLMAEVARHMAWLESVTDVPHVFPCTFHPYPPPRGVLLGSEPYRLSFAGWLGARGWVGHQHVPENSHGDPGAIDTARLSPAPEEDDVKPEDITAIGAEVARKLGQPVQAGEPGHESTLYDITTATNTAVGKDETRLVQLLELVMGQGNVLRDVLAAELADPGVADGTVTADTIAARVVAKLHDALAS